MKNFPALTVQITICTKRTPQISSFKMTEKYIIFFPSVASAGVFPGQVFLCPSPSCSIHHAQLIHQQSSGAAFLGSSGQGDSSQPSDSHQQSSALHKSGFLRLFLLIKESLNDNVEQELSFLAAGCRHDSTQG